MSESIVTARVEIVQWIDDNGGLRWDIDFDAGQTLTQTVGLLALAQMEMYRRALNEEDTT